MKKIQKGFTLIELMIVVAIIGILAAVAIPAYQDYIVKAKLSKVQSTLDPVKLALAMYYQENGSFITGSKTTSNTQATAYWTSLGLPNGAIMPDEVDGSAFVLDGTIGSGDTINMELKLQKIKAVGIDGFTVKILGTGGGSAITWTCPATPTGGSGTVSPILTKYFNC